MLAQGKPVIYFGLRGREARQAERIAACHGRRAALHRFSGRVHVHHEQDIHTPPPVRREFGGGSGSVGDDRYGSRAVRLRTR